MSVKATEPSTELQTENIYLPNCHILGWSNKEPKELKIQTYTSPFLCANESILFSVFALTATLTTITMIAAFLLFPLYFFIILSFFSCSVLLNKILFKKLQWLDLEQDREKK